MADDPVRHDRCLLVGRTAVRCQAQGGDAAGIDDLFNTGLRGIADQVGAAFDVNFVHGGGVRDPQPVIGGDVKQGIAAGNGAP